MALKTEILESISGLATEVTSAREALLKGELHSLNSIHARIETQCQLIVDLEPNEAAEVKPNLDELLENLRTFSDEIAYVQAKVTEILAETEKAQGGGDSSGP